MPGRSASAAIAVRGCELRLPREPVAPDTVGQNYPQLAAAPSAPATRILSPVDGRQEFIAVARVRDTPLVLTVTREAAVALHSWQDQATRLGGRTLVVALLGADRKST